MSQASGGRAKTTNMQFALAFTSQSCPRARATLGCCHFLGVKVSNLALRRLDLHNLTALADLTSRTPFWGRSGGQAWPFLGLYRVPSGPKIVPSPPRTALRTNFAARPEQVTSRLD